MKTPSCVRCFKRKVKCDKQRPCSACLRHNADCVYPVPNASRSRKERQEILLKRVQLYETLFDQLGVDPSSMIQTESLELQTTQYDGRSFGNDLSGASTADRGADRVREPLREYSKSQLVRRNDQSRYLDNSLWTRVMEEISETEDTFGYSSNEDNLQAEVPEDSTDFIFGLVPAPINISTFHPSGEYVLELWEVFVENVNALIKIVHEPSVGQALRNTIIDLDKIPQDPPKNLEALMFSIYSMATMSLTDSDCQERFNEQRRVLLARYRLATKAALLRAKFLGGGDIVTLQAFLLHLISMRNVYGPRTTWTLMGIANRLAEGMGLHRDGTHQALPPFDTEMRRRLWWQMKLFDAKIAELAGNARFRNISQDPQLTQMPTNVNDDHLYPGMSSLPDGSTEITSMCFSSLLCEFTHFWTKHAANMRARHGKDATLWDNYGSKSEILEKDEEIDRLEQILQDKYINGCDPTQPAQLLTLMVARDATTNMKFISHHPRRWASDGDVPDSERQFVWELAVKLLEVEVTMSSNRKLDRFAWHTSTYFPWAQAIHVVDCLRANPFLPDAAKAWRLIGDIFEYRSEQLLERKLLNVAFGNLCLKAYNSRQAAMTQQGKSTSSRTPAYIAKLRAQRGASSTRRGQQTHQQTTTMDNLQDLAFPETIQQSSTLPTRNKNNASLQSVETYKLHSSSKNLDQNQANSSSESSWPLANYHDETIVSNTLEGDMALDIDLLLEQRNNLDDVDIQPMDWDQWDSLIENWNGSLTES